MLILHYPLSYILFFKTFSFNSHYLFHYYFEYLKKPISLYYLPAHRQHLPYFQAIEIWSNIDIIEANTKVTFNFDCRKASEVQEEMYAPILASTKKKKIEMLENDLYGSRVSVSSSGSD